MINTQYDPEPILGNVFVNEDVREFVGIYFADGSLITTQSHGSDLALDAPSITEAIDRDTINGDLNQQLILSGALLTRNTLGGSQLAEPITPWGTVSTLQRAQIYDLHHIRRYSPEYDRDTGLQLNGPNVRDSMALRVTITVTPLSSVSTNGSNNTPRLGLPPVKGLISRRRANRNKKTINNRLTKVRRLPIHSGSCFHTSSASVLPDLVLPSKPEGRK